MFRTTALKNIIRSGVIAKRMYAEAAAIGTLKLHFALPHETLYYGSNVTQVNVPGKSGKFGVLANHVPTIEQLSPGIVEIIEESSKSKKYYISGGFASVQPDSLLCVTAVEAFPLEQFSPDKVKTLLSEARNKVTSSDGKVAAENKIKVSILEELESLL
ncbi:hypothetical protein KAFR_0C00790 [Kazachstania africana CBS 2517]|uniref:ATP synthase subunit delta, mitochondrial n=1 Tax=Kazachstania africana (strain ATCC 22294 / BCRC 22015 / CBS 2517 / CECT 1963 / NBRC 1671 / NRRL Y-8276) TaxID=1071382 RepID=H2ARS4_KAZAF|nr:hypothetical protein KAFR_0C00790 [Kazachstania africana CBS 2517]CCF57074.1 hypothetical protein KAFR_0C00790 [Kazachstania africana CBS 2517]